MNHEHLHQVLAALRQEIVALAPEQTEQHEKLTHLLTQLERELDSAHGLSAKVQHLLEQFETEHPQLTEVLNRISILLGNMGL